MITRSVGIKVKKLFLSVSIVIGVLPSSAFAAGNSSLELIIGIGGMVVISALVLIVSMKAGKGASDPNNGNYADIHTLHSKVVSQLSDNHLYDMELVRQSGNTERTIENLGSYEIVQQVIATMQRAKIDLVSISGDENNMRIYRMSHNARGRQEGKRIGGFEIRKNGLLYPQNSLGHSQSSNVKDFTISEETNFEDINVNISKSMASVQNTSIKLDTFKNEEQKSIIKSFFEVSEHFDDLPQAIVSNFDSKTGEGSDEFGFMGIIRMLIIADAHLSGEADFTSDLREQFKSSDVEWQKKIGNDQSMLTINGVMAYGDSSPSKIQNEFISLWETCEHLVSQEEYDNDELDRELRLLHHSYMLDSRPKILDMNF